jgi:hypothetical protein
MVALGAAPQWWDSADETGSSYGGKTSIPAYPMDYYSSHGGEWNSSYHKAAAKKVADHQRTAVRS